MLPKTKEKNKLAKIVLVSCELNPLLKNQRGMCATPFTLLYCQRTAQISLCVYIEREYILYLCMENRIVK